MRAAIARGGCGYTRRMDETEPRKPIPHRAPSKAGASPADAKPGALRKAPTKKATAPTAAAKSAAPAEPAPRARRAPAKKTASGAAAAGGKTAAQSTEAAPSAARRLEQAELALESAPAGSAQASALPAFLASPEDAPAPPAPDEASARALRAIDWLSGRLPTPWSSRLRGWLLAAGADRPAAYLLLLWPAWWGLWFAAGDFPPIVLLCVFSLGVLLLRAAGCILQRILAARAAGSAWSGGELAPLGFALLVVAGLLLAINPFGRWLALAGLGFALIWPLARRAPALALLVRGFGYSWSIPLAFAATGDSLPPLAWLLLLAGVLFVAVQSTERAMAGTADGRPLARLFADAERTILAVLMLTFLLALTLAGARAGLGWPYFLAVAVVGALLIRQHRRTRRGEPAACLSAWRSNAWIGFTLWLGLLLAFAIGPAVGG